MKEVVILKASSGLEVGDELTLPTNLVLKLIANGDAKLKDTKDKTLDSKVKSVKSAKILENKAEKENCKEGCEDCKDCAETTNLPERK